MLDNAVEVLKVLPDEAADAAILWDCFEGAIRGLVSHCRTVNGYIVNVGDRVLANLQLKDVHHVIVEDGDSVSPTHQEFGETECAIQCLKGGVFVRCFGEHVFIVANIQVEHSSIGMTCELLGDLFGEGGDARVLDSNCVKGFEAVDQANCISFFFRNAEPVWAVQRVEVLIYAGIHLHLNNLANFVVDTQRYRNVVLNPGGVCDDWDFNRW